MHLYPETPRLADAGSDFVASGHLWLFELLEGGPLCFSMDSSGLLRFGDRERTGLATNRAPPRYRAAVRHVREHVDRDGLRAATADPGGITFCGVATYRRHFDYDWNAMPAFLGCEVWSSARQGWLPPDQAHAAFEGLGLQPVPVPEREQRARDFEPSAYTFPTARYAARPVAGVIIRKKAGGRARLLNPDVHDDHADLPAIHTATELVDWAQETAALPTVADPQEQVDLDTLVDELYRRVPPEFRPPAGPDESAVRAAFQQTLRGDRSA